MSKRSQKKKLLEDMSKQWLTCPEDCIDLYRQYMKHRKIEWVEIRDGCLWFVIDRKLRPHRWKVFE